MRHLRFLGYVDEVARAGSIRKAADHLNVTASAVNRRIMDLEQELDAKLFDRKPRGVRLTAAGELFVRYIREQSSDVDLMKSQIEDLKGLRRGTVRIACSQALALDFLPREIADFRARFPLVHFDVRVLDHERAMVGARGVRSRPRARVSPALSREFPAADDARTAPGGADGERSSARRAAQSAASRLRRLSGGVATEQHRRTAIAQRGDGAHQFAARYRRAIEFVRVPAQPRAARQGDLVPDQDRHARRR